MHLANCNPRPEVRPNNNNNRVGNPVYSDLILLGTLDPFCGSHRNSHRHHNMPSDNLQFLRSECFAVEAILICRDPYPGIDLREHRKDEPSQSLLVPYFVRDSKKISLAVC